MRLLALAVLLGCGVLGLYLAGPSRVALGPPDSRASEEAREASEAQDVDGGERAEDTRNASGTNQEVERDSAASGEDVRSAPLPVSGVVVQRGPLEIPVEGTGCAEAVERAELASRVGERIVRVNVEPGDVVRTGDVLVELDTRPFEIAVREAEVARSRAALQFDAEMFADAEAPSERREKVAHRTGLTEAELRLQRAELDLEGAVIRAPFAGRVAAVSARAGERAQPERSLVTIVALDPIRVPIEVLEADFGSLDNGDLALLSFPALGTDRFRAKVRALGPEIDPERGTGLAYVELPNPDGRIRPGMFAEASVAADVLTDRLAVPRDAVLERDRRLLVFVARDGRAEWSYVQTGIETAERIEILSGLAPGDTVLVGGHLTLAHGAPVSVKLGRPDGARS